MSTPTWLITGTSSGLGLSLSQHILRKGHNLISISRHSQPDTSLISLAKTYHDPSSNTSSSTSHQQTLHHIPLDLSNPSPSQIPTALSKFLTSNPATTIDVLVNNAAVTLFDAVENTSPSTLSTVMTTNFFSPTYLIQAVLPHMRGSPSTHEKVIVNISSTQGVCTDPSEVAYDASKHAVEAMSGVLAGEVASFGIRVVVVELGSLRTGFAKSGERMRGERQGEGVGDGEGDGASGSGRGRDPYAHPDHPVAKRMAMVRKLVDVPGLAKGDAGKTAGVLFDGVMRTSGSVVDQVLELQRQRTLEEAGRNGIGKVERLVLGSDAQPKIERVLERLRFDVESCRVVSGLVEAD